ncbi:MAG: DNA repair protein RecN [Paracoccaceae bacterium]|nr:DNA repair protein RecN [Paracoccaceae bacterium]
MLTSLSIRNMLLVEEAEIYFSSGLNVFTGETGAGKSIILDCLSFVLGNKSRKRFVRTLCDRGEVIAEFKVKKTSEVRKLVEGLSIIWTDNLVIRRVEFSDGKRKTYVNDTNCTLDTIQKLGAKLVEFVDQKDGSQILKKSNHITLLDDFSGHQNEVKNLGKAWDDLKKTQQEITKVESRKDSQGKELEFVKQSLSAISILNPQPGELEELEIIRASLRSSSKIEENLKEAADLISGQQVRHEFVSALNKLEKAHDLVSDQLLVETISALEGIIHELDEIEKNIPNIIEKRNSGGMTLEEVEDRLFNFRNIARKHGINPENLMVLNQEMEASLIEYDNTEKHLVALMSTLVSLEKAYQASAEKISEKRKREGKNLDMMMSQELIPLKMEGIEFRTLLERRREQGFNGCDTVAFQICNHGMPAKDMEKIASGGELSRLLLALKVCLVANTSGTSLIFDEIDRGIGGATAEAVGNRLASLAERDQILLVTHSPQVASKAHKHWSVRKIAEKTNPPVTLLNELSQDAKVAELARMISGEVVSKEALAAAHRLMN